MIEGFQAKRRLEGASNRTVNMDVGALRQVLKRFKQWRRLEDDVKMLTEAGGEPIGRVLTSVEQERLLKAAEANPEWEHVWCAAQLAANTSMRGVEVKHVRRKDSMPRSARPHTREQERNEQAGDSAERFRVQRGATDGDTRGQDRALGPAPLPMVRKPAQQAGTHQTGEQVGRRRGVRYVMRLGYLACASTICVTRLSRGSSRPANRTTWSKRSPATSRRRMLEHYSHIRLRAKKAALDRLDESQSLGRLRPQNEAVDSSDCSTLSVVCSSAVQDTTPMSKTTADDRRPRVLLADDDAAVLKAISRTLATDFEVVATVADGRKALDAVPRLDPDVVVLDVSMPGLDGFQTAEELKRLGSRAKIVFLTMHQDDDFVTKAIRCGVGYVPKPSPGRI